MYQAVFDLKGRTYFSSAQWKTKEECLKDVIGVLFRRLKGPSLVSKIIRITIWSNQELVDTLT